MGTYLITGAGSGIGAALAELLSRRGDHLILVSRNEERASELRDRFRGARTIVVDLADERIESALQDVAPLPPLDGLVHVAGTTELEQVAHLTESSFLQTLAVNLMSPVALTRWSLPALRQGRGTVLFVNSTAALTVNPGWSAYAAAKAGLRAIADGLRAEEASHGIRVTTVFPSRTATPLQRHVRDQEAGEYEPSRYMEPSTVAAQLVTVLDLPRDAMVAELVLRPASRS